jgi:hypothetical protein
LIVAAPSYGWLTGLTDHLNKNFSNKWAYSGSFAMYCIAAAQGKACRDPNDIDILTSEVEGVWYSVRAALDGSFSGPPGVKTKKCTVQNAKLFIDGISPYTVDIDVLAADDQYGDLNNVSLLRQGATTLRVAGLTTLRNSKSNILKNQMLSQFHEDAQADLDFLNTLA